MKQLLIYQEPLVLNRDRHRDLRVRPGSGGYDFARELNSVPLTTVEFAQAARDYPIVFSDGIDAGMPAVLLGLSRDNNLFVEPDGQWLPQHYVPAFLRRYPFVVAGSDTAQAEMTVCIDQPFVTTEQNGLRLFEESGEHAPALVRAISFLSEYQQEVQRTQAFMQQLREHKLLMAKTVRVEMPGSEPQTLNGFSVVDETRLQKLGGKTLEKLSRTGALGLLYVHLMSLVNVQRLSTRLDAQRAQQPLH